MLNALNTECSDFAEPTCRARLCLIETRSFSLCSSSASLLCSSCRCSARRCPSCACTSTSCQQTAGPAFNTSVTYARMGPFTCAHCCCSHPQLRQLCKRCHQQNAMQTRQSMNTASSHHTCCLAAFSFAALLWRLSLRASSACRLISASRFCHSSS